MPSLFTRNFGIFNATTFEYFVSTGLSKLYITLGRPQEWSNTADYALAGNDAVVTPVDTSNTYYGVWNDMIGMKRVTSADINLVIPRVDWVANTRYVEYTQDAQIFARANSSNIAYDNKFYVRNTRDQIFKCLFNNANSGGVAALSTQMPQIDVGGQLPENPYIETSDGYRWKYMYTIPYGLKQKFFTSDYMPIVDEQIVTNSAENGRIDIVKIISDGAGFNANTNNNFLDILTVNGDGTGANIRVNVQSSAANGGNIVGYTVVSGGNNYTRASISLIDVNKSPDTANANLVAVIGPPGGHGSNVASELGASFMMISTTIEGTEDDTIPAISGGVNRFRQVCIMKDPMLTTDVLATESVYRTTTKYFLAATSGAFQNREKIYSGASLATANLTAVVEHYDSPNSVLYINNTINAANINLSNSFTVTGANSGATSTVISYEDTTVKLYSGELLYVQNSSYITRDPTEHQQVKIVLRF